MYNMRKACMQLEGTIKLHSLLVVQSTHVQRRLQGTVQSVLLCDRFACARIQAVLGTLPKYEYSNANLQDQHHGSLVSYLGGRQPQTPLLSFFYFSLYLEQACKLVIVLHEPA